VLHVFPSGLTPETAWPSNATSRQGIYALPNGYAGLLEQQVEAGQPEGAARCGLLQLAGRAVGASFVGATSACPGIAEVLREFLGGRAAGIPSYEVIAVSAANPARVSTAVNEWDGQIDSPGFIRCDVR